MPELQGLHYLCRMDADSFFTEPLQEDIFAVMHKKNFKYGFRVLHAVLSDNVQNLKALAQDYMSRHSANKGYAPIPLELKGVKSHHMVDSNFEVVHVSTFAEDPHIQRLISSSHALEQIHPNQWKDGTLRTIICRMFVPASQIHAFKFSFYHHGFFRPKQKLLRPL